MANYDLQLIGLTVIRFLSHSLFYLQIEFNETVSNIMPTLCVCSLLSFNSSAKGLSRESGERGNEYKYTGNWRRSK